VRWKDSLLTIEEDLEVILGNIAISSAAVGYLGPFTGLFRDKIISEWMTFIDELELKKSESFNLTGCLGDTFEIRGWNNMGLPSDNISVVNGLLVKYAS
jgi:dynein heavy chain